MSTREAEFAALSSVVYHRTNSENSINASTLGWSVVKDANGTPLTLPDDLAGFSAGVFEKNGEIAIVFTGTDPTSIMDWASDVDAGRGKLAMQAVEAVSLVARVQKLRPGAPITFAGHSLGGGLAGLMAVYFDRPAYVYAPAPFEASVTNLSTASSYWNFYSDCCEELGIPKDSSFKEHLNNHQIS